MRKHRTQVGRRLWGRRALINAGDAFHCASISSLSIDNPRLNKISYSSSLYYSLTDRMESIFFWVEPHFIRLFFLRKKQLILCELGSTCTFETRLYKLKNVKNLKYPSNFIAKGLILLPFIFLLVIIQSWICNQVEFISSFFFYSKTLCDSTSTWKYTFKTRLYGLKDIKNLKYPLNRGNFISKDRTVVRLTLILFNVGFDVSATLISKRVKYPSKLDCN